MSSVMAVEVSDISKTYVRSKPVLAKAVDNIGFTIGCGKKMGLVGLNGAGKTTIIKIMCGLIKPTSGHVYLNGYNVVQNRIDAMSQIGVVLEGTNNIHPRLSIWENLLYFGRLKGCSGNVLKERAKNLMADLDLKDYPDTPARKLSRGTQQKIAFACAAVADPPILIFDEPLQDLDVDSIDTVKSWILKLAREMAKTVVLATHQIAVAQELCDRAAIIRDGRLLASASIEELIRIFGQEYYQIRVKGLEDGGVPLLDQMFLHRENGEAMIEGRLLHQDTVNGLKEKMKELNLTILSFKRIEPNLEEAFLRITSGGKMSTMQ